MPVPPQWKFVLCRLDGTQIGEVIQATNRKVDILLNRLSTAEFTVRLDNPIANTLLEMDLLLKAYRGETLAYIGMVASAEEKAVGTDDQVKSIAVTTISPAWRLTKRMVGKSLGPTHPGATFGTAASPVDKGQIMKQMIDTANVNPSGTLRTGVRTSVGPVQASSTTVLGPVHFKPVLEAITEMLGSVAAPEIEFAPIEPTGAWPNTAVVDFKAYYPRMGVDRPNAVFEYGCGKNNVQSYTRTITNEHLLNQAYVLPTGFPDTTALVKASTDPPLAENRVWNPTFGTNTTRWTAAAATFTRDATTGVTPANTSGKLVATASSGVYAQTSTVNGEKIPVTPSVPWTASASIKNSVAGVNKARCDIYWYNASNTLISTTVGSYYTKTANTWERIYTTATAPAAAAFAVLRFWTNSGGASGQVSWVSAVQMEKSPVVTPYFDGSYSGASWLGTAHNSQSQVSALDERGLYENVIETDVVADSYRQSLADEHVRLRKQFRQIIQVEPVINADVQPFTDYYIGDSIVVRAIVGDYVRFEGLVRVYGLSFEIDEFGNEKVTQELVIPDV